MMRVQILIFVLGAAVGAALGYSLRHECFDIPVAGVMHDWLVVTDAEQVVCESPSVFRRARQIQCP